MNFDIHGIFKLKMVGTDRRILKHLEREYAYFKTDDKINSELDIVVGDFTPPSNKSYIFQKNRYKIVRWSLCIENIETKPTIRFRGGIFSGMFLERDIIEPLVGFKLAQKGYSLLHASSVASNNKGFIFAGDPGTGKTTMITNLMGNNIFLCDEVAILSRGGIVYSFPSPILLYKYNLKGVPGIYRRMTMLNKFEVGIKYLAYILSLKYGKLPFAISPERLFSKVGGAYPIHCLALLTRANSDRVELAGNIGKEELVERLTLINKHQFHYLNKCIPMQGHWRTTKDILFDALRQVTCCEIKMPLTNSQSTHQEIKMVLREIGALPSE